MSTLKKEVRRFLVAGCTAVVTDYLVYFVLLKQLPAEPAKAISFITGSVVAYLINKYWTFEQPRRSYQEIFKFAALYTSTLGANVLVNDITLTISQGVYLIAFLMATGTSTCINFVGQKWWVFR